LAEEFDIGLYRPCKFPTSDQAQIEFYRISQKGLIQEYVTENTDSIKVRHFFETVSSTMIT
jgi:hypothetical protein